ncbi:Maltodextrin phosphorylase [Klebsiella variicola]|nr:Maltodextrin phosphorylase [Klebsiella variicola]
MFILGKDPSLANKHEWLNATLFAVRDRLVERWLRAHRARISQQARQVYYLSMEFLIGRTLSNALLSLGIYEDVKTALAGMGLDLEELIDEENDPGLGNGGLGRLAACFLDSLATLGLPGRGYGIRYDYGMFKQNIIDGRQMESPDYWLEYGNPGNSSAIKPAIPCALAGAFSMRGKTRAGWKPKRSSRWPTIRLSRVMKPMPPTPCACGRRPAARLTSVNLIRRLLRGGRR